LWMLGLTQDLCLHPNAAGHFAIAESVLAAMRSRVGLERGVFAYPTRGDGRIAWSRRTRREPLGTLTCEVRCLAQFAVTLFPRAGGNARAARRTHQAIHLRVTVRAQRNRPMRVTTRPSTGARRIMNRARLLSALLRIRIQYPGRRVSRWRLVTISMV
jgi:hypothetical protein